MNIRQAILKAADQIERHPELFDFFSYKTPDPHCGTPGCAIGWISYYANVPIIMKDTGINFDHVEQLLGCDETDFYDRMKGFIYWWERDSSDCAQALRFYADKFHPEQGIPESVRQIFEVERVS